MFAMTESIFWENPKPFDNGTYTMGPMLGTGF
jgi:hypothetical protein